MADPESRFRITVLSPLTPRKAYATTGTPPVRGYFADDGKIDTLLGQIPVGLKLEVGDPFGGSEARFRVDLRLTSLKSFKPEAIIEQVTALRALAQVPARLAELAQKGADRAAMVEELARLLPVRAWAEALAPTTTTAAPTKPAAPPTAATIDSLLDQVEVPAEAPPPRPAGLSSLISQVARGGSASRASSPAVGRDRAVRALASMLSDILDHPEFRRLERAWRGARYLMSEGARPVELEFIPIDDTTLPDALAHLVERPQEVSPPPNLLVLDLELPLTPDGLAALEVPAAIAEQLRAPLVVGAKAEELLEDDDTTKALREAGASDWASWVVIAVNGALVRGPYATSAFKQDTSAPGAHCFAPAPYLLAALAARAYRHDGWASGVSGPEAGQLGGFEVHGVLSGGESSAFATEKMVSIEAAKKHARRGLFALTSVPNRDTVVSASVPTLAAAANKEAPTFSDQMFVARVVNVMTAVAQSIPDGTPPERVEEVASVVLGELFPRHGGSLPSYAVHVKNGKLAVSVSPRRFAGTTMGELAFETELSEA